MADNSGRSDERASSGYQHNPYGSKVFEYEGDTDGTPATPNTRSAISQAFRTQQDVARTPISMQPATSTSSFASNSFVSAGNNSIFGGMRSRGTSGAEVPSPISPQPSERRRVPPNTKINATSSPLMCSSSSFVSPSSATAPPVQQHQIQQLVFATSQNLSTPSSSYHTAQQPTPQQAGFPSRPAVADSHAYSTSSNFSNPASTYSAQATPNQLSQAPTQSPPAYRSSSTPLVDVSSPPPPYLAPPLLSSSNGGVYVSPSPSPLFPQPGGSQQQQHYSPGSSIMQTSKPNGTMPPRSLSNSELFDLSPNWSTSVRVGGQLMNQTPVLAPESMAAYQRLCSLSPTRSATESPSVVDFATPAHLRKRRPDAGSRSVKDDPIPESGRSTAISDTEQVKEEAAQGSTPQTTSKKNRNKGRKNSGKKSQKDVPERKSPLDAKSPSPHQQQHQQRHPATEPRGNKSPMTNNKEEDDESGEDDNGEQNSVYDCYFLKLTRVDLPLERTELLTQRVYKREKQIQLGYQTEGYKNYTQLVCRKDRQANNPNHPITPRAQVLSSRRLFKAVLQKWRTDLHYWDNKDSVEETLLPSCATLGELCLEGEKPGSPQLFALQLCDPRSVTPRNVESPTFQIRSLQSPQEERSSATTKCKELMLEDADDILANTTNSLTEGVEPSGRPSTPPPTGPKTPMGSNTPLRFVRPVPQRPLPKSDSPSTSSATQEDDN